MVSIAVRASQKDNYYLASLQEQLDNAARSIFGAPNLNSFAKVSQLTRDMQGNDGCRDGHAKLI